MKTDNMEILLTGANDYIGSHTYVELLNAAYDVVGIDNFINSRPDVLIRLKRFVAKVFNFSKAMLLLQRCCKVFSLNIR